MNWRVTLWALDGHLGYLGHLKCTRNTPFNRMAITPWSHLVESLVLSHDHAVAIQEITSVYHRWNVTCFGGWGVFNSRRHQYI